MKLYFLVEFKPLVFPQHGSYLSFVATILTEGTVFACVGLPWLLPSMVIRLNLPLPLGYE